MRRMLLTAAVVLAGASAAPAQAHNDRVRAWTTTGDRQHLLDRVQVAPPQQDAPTITVDKRARFQRIEGLGASITDSSAHLLARSPHRDAIMRDLFRDLELSYLRQPMGSSDFAAGPHYTYDDNGPDFAMRNFSVAHDEREILPLLRQARRYNRELKVMGTPWSPPAWMKTPARLDGGRFIDDQRYYDAYARYFVKFVQAYRRAGVPVDALTLQNEPQNSTPDAYPGMDFRIAQEARLIRTVGPALRRARLNTKLLGYDHNWTLHPDDQAEGAEPGYAKALLDDPDTRRWLAGTAFHCYSGDPEAQSALHDAHPDKDIYFTECSGTESSDPSTTFADTLHWHTRYLTVGAVRNWAKTVITWNLALDPEGGPHNGGCGTCVGVVTIDPATGKATREADYYVLGHVTKFVEPGARRIASSVEGNIHTVAFRNPGGEVVVVAVNDDWGDGEQTFNLRSGRRTVSYTLPAGAVVTFTM